MSELWQLAATDIAALVRARKASAREVTEASLARCDAVNPKLNAVVQQDRATSLAAADALDARIARGEAPGPLAGVPVTTKVNVDQAGFATTNGMKLQRDNLASEDNPVVANLKRAGAIVIGRTNTPAFSARWFTRNGLHGATKNPRDATRTPGGSSGGAGAAVAAGIGAIAHGTDIAGSIRYPAYACGVHGLRPGLGRVPAWNPSGPDRLIGAQLMAVSGPLARSIADLGLAYTAMATADPRDPWWAPVPHALPALPKRAALCVRPDGLATEPVVERALRDAAARLQDAGWTIVETACPPLREPLRLQLALWFAEQRRIRDLITQEADPDLDFVMAQMDAIVPAPGMDDFMEIFRARAGFCRQWELFLRDYPVLICPVSAELPFPDHLDVVSPDSFRRVLEAQLTQIALPLMSLPALAVATGDADGVPVGAQLVAARWREDVLLDAAASIEARGAKVAIAEP
jgi:amidase